MILITTSSDMSPFWTWRGGTLCFFAVVKILALSVCGFSWHTNEPFENNKRTFVSFFKKMPIGGRERGRDGGREGGG